MIPQMEAKWHKLVSGPHTRARASPSLLLSLNLKRVEGVEVKCSYVWCCVCSRLSETIVFCMMTTVAQIGLIHKF